MCHTAELGTVKPSTNSTGLGQRSTNVHKGNTYFDDFGYHLPFIHPTGEFGLEYEQYANTMGDTGNAVGANNSFLHDLP
jgi:hypothetical protein